MSEEPEPDPESGDPSEADGPDSDGSGPSAGESGEADDQSPDDDTPAEEDLDELAGDGREEVDETGDDTSGETADETANEAGDDPSTTGGEHDEVETDEESGLRRVDDEGPEEPPEDAGDDPAGADGAFEAPSSDVDPDEADSWEEFNEMAAEEDEPTHPMADPVRTPRPKDPEAFEEERSQAGDDVETTAEANEETSDDETESQSPPADVPPGADADADLVTEAPPDPEPADPDAAAPGATTPEGAEGERHHGTVDPPEDAGLDPEEGPFADAIEEPGTAGEQPAQPPGDEEMPLAEHVEEMVKRLGIVLVTAGAVSLLAYPFTERLIMAIWNGVLPTADAPPPYLFGPLEKIIIQLKLAGLIGLVAGLPMLVYQSYRFMRPGLYPNERRYYLAAVPTSLVLAAIGIAFSYFAVLPALFVYFMYYSKGSAIIAFGLSKTFGLILTLLGLLAVVFQIPLFIMLAIMMGVTSRRWLEDNRIYFWGGFLGVAFLFAPDPTGMAPFIVAITEVALFEGTLLLLRWVGR